MKNQSTKILLGVCLIAIWGLLGFRIAAKLKHNEPLSLVEIGVPKKQRSLNPFSFELNLDYRDPFKAGPKLKAASPIPQQKVNTATRISLVTKKKKELKVPKIEYRGHIISKSGRNTAVLKIENDFINLSQGEKFNDIFLQQIFEDSIIMNLHKQKLVIKKVQE